MRSAHEILGVAPDATEAQISKAYKEGAMKWHPDKNGGSKEAHEKMAELNDAVEKMKMQDNDPVPECPRYKSPPPRRRRESSPPVPDWSPREPSFARYSTAAPRYTRDSRDDPNFAKYYDGEPIFEERRPRGASKETERSDPERRRSRPRSYRPDPPPKEREYTARGRSGPEEDRYRRRPSSPRPRDPSTVHYEERTPRKPSKTERAVHHVTTRTRYSCDLSTAPRYKQPRHAPSPHIKLSEESNTLPGYETVLKLSSESRKLASRTENALKNLTTWLKQTVQLPRLNPSCMDLAYNAHDDAIKTRQQRDALGDTFHSLTSGDDWARQARAEEIFDVHDALLKMYTVLRTVEEEVSVLVANFVDNKGRRFDREYDWGSKRRQELWDGLEWFRGRIAVVIPSSVSAAAAAPAGAGSGRRRRTTTTIYHVRYQ